MDDFLSWLSGLLEGIVEFALSWLPNDPFKDALGEFSNFATASSTGLGWLNWFFPFGDTAGMLALVVTAVLVCAVARLVFTIVELIPGE